MSGAGGLAGRAAGAALLGGLLGAWGLGAQATHAARRPATLHSQKTSAKKSVGIEPERAAEIEHALVTAGYLETVSGRWDEAAAAAMKKYQQDHHWQDKFVPDARALIALGLGPQPAG